MSWWVLAVAALVIFAAASNGWLVYVVVRRMEAAAAEERRLLLNHLLADSPQEFVALAAASRPDATVEAIADAKAQRPSPLTKPGPLGL